MSKTENHYEEKEYHQIAKFLCDINSKLGQVKLLDSLVSKIATDVDDLNRKLNELKTRFDNHEINILPRFKEEILTCLEDDEFRVSLLKLLFPGSDSFDYYTRAISTTAETPEEKKSGTCHIIGNYATPGIDIINRSLKSGQEMINLNGIDRPVDANKTNKDKIWDEHGAYATALDQHGRVNKTLIDPPHENTAIGENPLFSTPSDNKSDTPDETGKHVPDVGEMINLNPSNSGELEKAHDELEKAIKGLCIKASLHQNYESLFTENIEKLRQAYNNWREVKGGYTQVAQR